MSTTDFTRDPIIDSIVPPARLPRAYGVVFTFTYDANTGEADALDAYEREGLVMDRVEDTRDVLHDELQKLVPCAIGFEGDSIVYAVDRSVSPDLVARAAEAVVLLNEEHDVRVLVDFVGEDALNTITLNAETDMHLFEYDEPYAYGLRGRMDPLTKERVETLIAWVVEERIPQ